MTRRLGTLAPLFVYVIIDVHAPLVSIIEQEHKKNQNKKCLLLGALIALSVHVHEK